MSVSTPEVKKKHVENGSVFAQCVHQNSNSKSIFLKRGWMGGFKNEVLNVEMFNRQNCECNYFQLSMLHLALNFQTISTSHLA